MFHEKKGKIEKERENKQEKIKESGKEDNEDKVRKEKIKESSGGEKRIKRKTEIKRDRIYQSQKEKDYRN